MPREKDHDSTAHTGLPASLLGFWVSGDLCGLTIYTNRFGKKVFFQEAPALKPPSPLQVIQRNRFRTAFQNWKALTKTQKANLELAVNRASLCLTGQNLYVSASLTNRAEVVGTIARQTGLVLPIPTFVP